MGHRAFTLLEEGVAECIASGVFRPVNLRLASQTLWACVHGITSLLIARPDFPWTEQDRTIDLLLDVICAGFAAEETVLSRDDLYLADEVFVCGTAAEVIGLREIDFRRVGSGTTGPITRLVQDLYRAATHGEHVRSREWLTSVTTARARKSA